ncbi:MAG: tRNA threonylcarbamoyladenosine dehydratase [Ruminococcaceae bacterium]|nr:tRNA threonylcarbamoyladenosine dehydratase [Oscillospiraceae bacterium]
MNDIYKRTQALLGENAMEKIKSSKVLLFGVGGVGSYCAEALARAGIGSFTLVDGDIVNPTNINRQLIALNSTVGRYKTEVMKDRMLDINPLINVDCVNEYYSEEYDTMNFIDFAQYDYVVDCIDSIKDKLYIICKAQNTGVPIISSMGAANKLDPSRFIITDIYKTTNCPLAKVMRHKLRELGVKSLKVAFSGENPVKPIVPDTPLGSVSFVPSACGLVIAGEVIRNIAGVNL